MPGASRVRLHFLTPVRATGTLVADAFLAVVGNLAWVLYCLGELTSWFEEVIWKVFQRNFISYINASSGNPIVERLCRLLPVCG